MVIYYNDLLFLYFLEQPRPTGNNALRLAGIGRGRARR